jgi:hypothetical protein
MDLPTGCDIMDLSTCCDIHCHGLINLINKGVLDGFVHWW